MANMAAPTAFLLLLLVQLLPEAQGVPVAEASTAMTGPRGTATSSPSTIIDGTTAATAATTSSPTATTTTAGAAAGHTTSSTNTGASGSYACADPALASLPFCDPQLPFAERARNLVERMTAAEKVSQLGTVAGAIPRLGVAKYQWWAEALHGLAFSPGVQFGPTIPAATSFPEVITTAASFNRSLFSAIGTAVSTEARAFANAGQAGVAFFSPNINIVRDPRWGRSLETPGEDPLLASEYAAAYVAAMQGDHPTYLKTAATCKHYAAYDLEGWHGVDRFHFDARVSERDLAETFLPPFEACVTGGRAASVMCSYNRVNGVPSCANTRLLQDILRGDWAFAGHVASDCGAIDMLLDAQHYASTPEEAVALALAAGCDLDCGGYYQAHVGDALRQGVASERHVDVAVARLMELRLRLGLFDPPHLVPFTDAADFGPAAACSPQHRRLAREAAQQGIVLLKNVAMAAPAAAAGAGSTISRPVRAGPDHRPVLPLDPAAYPKLAVVGPNAEMEDRMLGNYYGLPCNITTPAQGLASYHQGGGGSGSGGWLRVVQGCDDVACKTAHGFQEAVEAAAEADAVILVMGLDTTQEQESRDREEISLPGRQRALVEAVAAAARGPVVLVYMSGASVDVSFAKHSAAVHAVLWSGYPGQAGGLALADVIFGAVSPSGRMPFTTYPADYVDGLDFFNMSMRAGPGRTYRFYTGEAVYPFGFGLSYTTFDYAWLDWPRDTAASVAAAAGGGRRSRVLETTAEELAAGGDVVVRLSVTNTGARAGDEVVLLFVQAVDVASTAGIDSPPLRELKAFSRVSLAPGATAELEFALGAAALSLVDGRGRRVLVHSSWRIVAGNVAANLRVTAAAAGPLVLRDVSGLGRATE